MENPVLRGRIDEGKVSGTIKIECGGINQWIVTRVLDYTDHDKHQETTVLTATLPGAITLEFSQYPQRRQALPLTRSHDAPENMLLIQQLGALYGHCSAGGKNEQLEVELPKDDIESFNSIMNRMVGIVRLGVGQRRGATKMDDEGVALIGAEPQSRGRC